jgi:hypothetical protein
LSGMIRVETASWSPFKMTFLNNKELPVVPYQQGWLLGRPQATTYFDFFNEHSNEVGVADHIHFRIEHFELMIRVFMTSQSLLSKVFIPSRLVWEMTVCIINLLTNTKVAFPP